MPVDLIALVQAVGGLSSLVGVTVDIVNRARFRDEERSDEIKSNISRIDNTLSQIRKIGQSLNDYKDLLEVSTRLSTSTDNLHGTLGFIQQAKVDDLSSDASQFMHNQVDSLFRRCREIFVHDLSNFPREAEYLDSLDQGALTLTISKITGFVGAAEQLINQNPIDYSGLRLRIRDMDYAADDLVAMSKSKINLIIKSLSRVGER